MTHRGDIRQSYGGVGRNLGDALARLRCRPLLISAVGDDTHARALTAHNPKMVRGNHASAFGFGFIMASRTAINNIIVLITEIIMSRNRH